MECSVSNDQQMEIEELKSQLYQVRSQIYNMEKAHQKDMEIITVETGRSN